MVTTVLRRAASAPRALADSVRSLAPRAAFHLAPGCPRDLHAVPGLGFSGRRPTLTTQLYGAPLEWSRPAPRSKTTARSRRVATQASMDALEAGLEIPKFCPGCGVKLQNESPKQAGYFVIPKALLEPKVEDEAFMEESVEVMAAQAALEAEAAAAPAGEEEEGSEDPGEAGDGMVMLEVEPDEVFDAFDDMLDDWDLGDEEDDDDEGESHGVGGDGGTPKRRGPRLGLSEPAVAEPLITCARCFSLTNYGKIKDEDAEETLPGFDFKLQVGDRIKRERGRRAVVLVVVDAGDFDGSLPREAMNSLKESHASMRVVLAVNKVDLLPPIASTGRVEAWVKRRCKAGGVPPVDAVHLVSAFSGTGVEALCDRMEKICGPAGGDVWVVGAQNAGKSSLINRLSVAYRGKGRGSKVTEAPLPGTTLGVVKLDGVMPSKFRVYDTPGVEHTYQLTARLSMEDVRPVLTRKQLKPRTYRMKMGTSLHLGALARIDVLEIPERASTIYATAWASADIMLHYGKEETSAELYAKHAAVGLLQPPEDPDRLKELGRWVSRDVEVFGDFWDRSSEDVAIAGLGWVGIGVSGSCLLRVWTFEGVQVTLRESLMPDLSRELLRPGFSAPPKPKGKAKGKKGGKKKK